MWCLFGHKFGKAEGNYQYCQKCGKARVMPCAHIWQEDGDRFEVIGCKTNSTKDVVTTVVCKICGKREGVSLYNLSEYERRHKE